MPGRCPFVPPTHSLNSAPRHQRILTGVPFLRDSHLFTAINIIGAVKVIVRFGNETSAYLDHNPKALRILRCNITDYATEKDSFQLTSAIYSYKWNRDTLLFTQCHDLLTEDIRFWVDGNFTIVWSCVEMNENEHDEAVLMLIEEPLSQRVDKLLLDPIWIQDKLSRLNDTARKYLSEPLLDRIDWSPEESQLFPKTDNNSLFMCKPLQGKASLWLILAAPLMFLGLLTVGLWCDADMCNKQSCNRVVPCEND